MLESVVNFSVRLSPTIHQKFEKEANKRKLTSRKMIEEMIEFYVTNNIKSSGEKEIANGANV